MLLFPSKITHHVYFPMHKWSRCIYKNNFTSIHSILGCDAV